MHTVLLAAVNFTAELTFDRARFEVCPAQELTHFDISHGNTQNEPQHILFTVHSAGPYADKGDGLPAAPELPSLALGHGPMGSGAAHFSTDLDASLFTRRVFIANTAVGLCWVKKEREKHLGWHPTQRKTDQNISSKSAEVIEMCGGWFF